MEKSKMHQKLKNHYELVKRKGQLFICRSRIKTFLPWLVKPAGCIYIFILVFLYPILLLSPQSTCSELCQFAAITPCHHSATCVTKTGQCPHLRARNQTWDNNRQSSNKRKETMIHQGKEATNVPLPWFKIQESLSNRLLWRSAAFKEIAVRN